MRDGNHFIYADGTGWVLIDGPWFDQLEEKAKNLDDRCNVVIARIVDPKRNVVLQASEEIAVCANVHYTRWTRILWHPGHVTTKAQRNELHYWTLHKLSQYEARRMRYGWITSGLLPAHLDYVGEYEE